MVNTGHPSEACFQCRVRKVKCDTTRPGCKRCAKLRVPCSGYPQKGAVTFRDDTRKTEARAKRIYSTLTRSRDVMPSEDADTGPSVAVVPQRQVPSSSFGPPPDLLKLSFFKDTIIIGSVSAFIDQWSQDGADLLGGNFTLGGKMYPSCIDCLKAAIETMALWNLSIVGEGADAQMQESVLDMYGRSLKEVRLALQSPKKRDMDQILLTIEYLGIFEALAEPQGNLERTREHLLGLLALIRARGSEQFASEIGRRIFLDAFWMFVCGSIVLPQPFSVPLPPDSADILLKSDYTRHTPEYTILPLLQKTLDHRVAAFNVLQTAESPNTATVVALKTANETLQTDWQAWLDANPSLHTEPPPDKFWLAGPLNLYRAMRIIVCDILVRLCYTLETLESSPLRYEEETTATLALAHSFVTQICNSLPYTSDPSEGSVDGSIIDDGFSGSGSGSGAMTTLKTDSRRAVQHMSYSFPLLVCSMVQSLNTEMEQAVACARKSQAKYYGLTKPFRVFPKRLVPDRSRGGY